VIPGPKLPPDQPGWTTEFQYGRILDPVRGAALAAAVDAYPYVKRLLDEDQGVPPDDYGAEILDLARTFEAYLTGEETDG
jgi:hypothetical protein